MSNAGVLNWRSAVLAAVLGLFAAGCGSDGSASTAGTDVAPAPARFVPCETGAPRLRHASEAPKAWTSGPRPAVPLSCSPDRVDHYSAIIGYERRDGGSCVAAYSVRLQKPFGELCRAQGSGWLRGCKGPGCVQGFIHNGKGTALAGPVEKQTVGIRFVVEGKPLLEGVIHADIRGKFLGEIGATEPFDYFEGSIPRCIEPDQVKVRLIDEKGHIIGTADEWDAPVPKCPPSS